jgi:hypothetical protein
VALWRAFVALPVSVGVLSALYNLLHRSPHALDGVYDLAWLALFILLTRNSVLRGLELAADDRVAAWPDLHGPLLRVLSALPPARPLPDRPEVDPG